MPLTHLLFKVHNNNNKTKLDKITKLFNKSTNVFSYAAFYYTCSLKQFEFVFTT